jgi:hypothetical protein
MWWLVSVIPAPLEEELQRVISDPFMFETSMGKTLLRPPAQSVSQAWWYVSMITATREDVGRRIMVQGPPLAKMPNPT